MKQLSLILLLSVHFITSFSQEQKEISYFDTHIEINYESLKAGFYDVPQEAKMRTWWFWMNGIATKQSITQDLVAMKTNGIAGAILIDNGGDYSPIGPTFMGKDWINLFAHVIKEADRLGIEISINIQSGAGDPGNPNIKDDNGLKKITWSERKVTGPKKIDIELYEEVTLYNDMRVSSGERPCVRSGRPLERCRFVCKSWRYRCRK